MDAKKYILIQNDGEIESNSFELIGASTKRGETGKIGFFGSGLKYSIAYMMRNGIDFRVFSGNQELVFTTTPEALKDKTFDRICINGKPTSYTVTMGPTWTEDWFVLREIYCNALDEGNCQLIKETEIVAPAEGKTRIYIECTGSLSKVVQNWDAYFSDEREPLFVVPKCYTSYIGSDDIGGDSHQSVSVFSKTEGVLYRKGIRCYTDPKKQLYDYGLNHVSINEDRTARSIGGLGYGISSMIAMLPNESYVVDILRNGTSEEDPCMEYLSISMDTPSEPFSEKWVGLSNEYLFVIKESSGKYVEEIQKSKKELLLIPSLFAKRMKIQLPAVNILGVGKQIGNAGIMDFEATPKMNYLLKEVLKSLSEMKYEVPYDIHIVEFDNENVLWQADSKDKKIYLSNRVFDMGRREIALTIMEECEHIYSGKGDETRAFQTHILSQWLKTMENQNGLFL